MTDPARAFVLMRLFEAPDLDALRRVWDGLGDDWKADRQVRELKDALKAKFEAEAGLQ